MRIPSIIGLVTAALLGLTGCAPRAAEAPPAVTTRVEAATAVRLPPTAGGFDYQLGGGFRPAHGVTVVTRDSTDRPAKGVYSICYVNGFQTQPGARWPASLLVHTADGRLLTDPGWPDEHLLDISTAAKRTAALRRQRTAIATCARKGFAAVELDNLDSWTRSRHRLTQADAVAFATRLVAAAHAKGLAVAQKNTTRLASVGRSRIGFDFAMAEECDRYRECGVYTKAYGRHVLDVEYTDDLRGAFAAVCRRAPAQTVLRDRDLVQRGRAGFVDRRC